MHTNTCTYTHMNTICCARRASAVELENSMYVCSRWCIELRHGRSLPSRGYTTNDNNVGTRIHSDYVCYQSSVNLLARETAIYSSMHIDAHSKLHMYYTPILHAKMLAQTFTCFFMTSGNFIRFATYITDTLEHRNRCSMSA